MKKQYLGDSIYIETWAHGGVRIYLNNGYDNQNEIFMEPEVIKAFQLFIENMYAASKNVNHNEPT